MLRLPRRWPVGFRSAARLALLAILLFMGWIGFIKLFRWGVDSSSALIMVWLSVLVLLLGGFPGLLGALERIKYKDIEVQLRSRLREVAEAGVISFGEESAAYALSKEGIRLLPDMLRELRSANPQLPVLLRVGIDRSNISWASLLAYVSLIRSIGFEVRMLFFSEANIDEQAKSVNPHRSQILGALTGRTFLRICLRRWPRLISPILGGPSNNWPAEEERVPDANSLIMWIERLRGEVVLRSDHAADEMTLSNFNAHVRPEADRVIVDAEAKPDDLRALRRALDGGDELVIVVREERFLSLVDVCSVARGIAARARVHTD